MIILFRCNACTKEKFLKKVWLIIYIQTNVDNQNRSNKLYKLNEKDKFFKSIFRKLRPDTVNFNSYVFFFY